MFCACHHRDDSYSNPFVNANRHSVDTCTDTIGVDIEFDLCMSVFVPIMQIVTLSTLVPTQLVWTLSLTCACLCLFLFFPTSISDACKAEPVLHFDGAHGATCILMVTVGQENVQVSHAYSTAE